MVHSKGISLLISVVFGICIGFSSFCFVSSFSRDEALAVHCDSGFDSNHSIPQIIHVIKLLPKTARRRKRRSNFSKQWEKLYGLQVITYRDKDVKHIFSNLPKSWLEAYDIAKLLIIQVDFLKLVIMYKYGGIIRYCDYDNLLD